MSFSYLLLIFTVLLETVFAFLAVRGLRKKIIWMIIVFSILFLAVPFVIFYVFSYGIILM
ncbi:MAG: hypothetical protein IJH32_04515 [Ruminococcus sp.]|nr:hypothetical protein [Ruminococcus sp.]